MRILILHDYLGNIGGGERLVLTLARELRADIATLDFDRRVVEQMGFSDVKVINMGTTPKIPLLKQVFATLKYLSCDFRRDYDIFIFSGNWAHYASRRHSPSLWYCHTPTRVFYDLRGQYLQRVGFPKSMLLRIWTGIHSRLDRWSAGRITRIVTNSVNTQGRIRKYYGREAEVVYTAVDTKKFRQKPPGDFWLSVNRIYPEKRIELQFDTFRLLAGMKLKIVGDILEGDHASDYKARILQQKPLNVEILSSVSEASLIELYASCRGLICTAQDEDLGLTPIEAMASGKPVVAADEGGFRETVLDGQTGRLVKATAKDMAAAIAEVDRDPGAYSKACVRQAAKFDGQIFSRRMISILNQL